MRQYDDITAQSVSTADALMVRAGGQAMVRIEKRSGRSEEFSQGKLEESLRRAGASTEIARRVSARVSPREGQSTSELRRAVADELRKEDQALSAAYASTRRLSARSSTRASAGVAHVHESLLKSLDLSAGQTARLRLGGKEAELRLEKAADLNHAEIELNSADLERLGAREGSRQEFRISR